MPKQDEMDFESYVSEHIVPKASKAAKVPLLLLQCMDSRYPRRILETMDSLGLRGKYDQLVLAGASLGVVHSEQWRNTFLDHLGFAITEHGVKEVLILDHRDCGSALPSARCAGGARHQTRGGRGRACGAHRAVWT